MDTGNKNVFINCPFDKDYEKFLRAMMFAVAYCGFKPQLATLDRNAGQTRIQKIQEMIRGAKYGLHDISRCKAQEAGEHYRMNMPFEIGLDFGCAVYGNEEQHRKKLAILVSERYEYQKSLSDLSGNDPICYEGKVEKLVKEVRDWFYEQTDNKDKFPSGSEVWNAYHDCMAAMNDELGKKGVKDLKPQEFLDKINCYIEED